MEAEGVPRIVLTAHGWKVLPQRTVLRPEDSARELNPKLLFPELRMQMLARVEADWTQGAYSDLVSAVIVPLLPLKLWSQKC